MKLHHTEYKKNYRTYILDHITDQNGDPFKTDQEKIDRFLNQNTIGILSTKDISKLWFHGYKAWRYHLLATIMRSLTLLLRWAALMKIHPTSFVIVL